MDISKLSNVMAAVSAFGTPKPGISSTEFWAHGIVSAYAALSPAVPAPWNVVVPLVSVSVYGLGRAIVKAAHAMGKLQSIPELPEKP